MRVTPIHKTLTAGTPGVIVWAGRCALTSCVHAGDGVNDYELVVYDALSATGTQVIPKAPHDAGEYGLRGQEKNYESDCINGIYVIAYDIGGGGYSGGAINITIDVLVG